MLTKLSICPARKRSLCLKRDFGYIILENSEAGFVKPEDTPVVTETGWGAYGDWGRRTESWPVRRILYQPRLDRVIAGQPTGDRQRNFSFKGGRILA